MPKVSREIPAGDMLAKQLLSLFQKIEQHQASFLPQLYESLARVRAKVGGRKRAYDLRPLAHLVMERLIPAQRETLTNRSEASPKRIQAIYQEIADLPFGFDQVSTALFVIRSVIGEHIGKWFAGTRRGGILEASEEFWLQGLLETAKAFLRNQEKIIREKNMESSVLFHATQSITTELDLQALLYNLVFHASMLMHTKQVYLFLAESQSPAGKEPRRLNLEAWSHAEATYGEYSVKFGEGHVGEAAETRLPVISNDYGRAAQKIPFLSDVKRLIAVPIVFAEEVLGVLAAAADSHREQRYTEADQELFMGFANQVAVTLKNVLLYQEQTRFARELEEKNKMLESQADMIIRKSAQLVVLNEVGQEVAASLEFKEVLALLTRHAAESIGVDRSVVWLLDGKKNCLDAVAAYGYPQEELDQLTLHLSDIRRTRFFQALMEQHAVEVAEGQDDELFQALLHGKLTIRSLLAVPLLLKQQALGLLVVDETRETHRFLEDEVTLVSAIANQAVLAIENARLYLQVKEQAITDGLTGLYNHRFFQLRFADEFAHCKRYGNDLALIMLDIDHFKEYNDSFGHIAGDLALKEIANLTRASVRENDLVARYGGEEFVIILPMTNLEGAKVVAERIRESVLNCRFLGDMKIPQVSITVSLGVSAYRQGVDNREDLLREADDALYQAKESGRNRVIVHSI